jgi:SprT-like protein
MLMARFSGLKICLRLRQKAVVKMTDEALQQWVESVSLRFFQKPFLHKARFNSRLRTTGGRLLLKTHDIEINPRQLEMHGAAETERIIKHELCHYHLHLAGKGYRHSDADFKRLLLQVGGSRYCRPTAERKTLSFKYRLTCQQCGMRYKRKRLVDTRRFVCGRCHGRLKLEKL